MSKDYTLHVTMFDGFSIKNDYYEFRKDAKRAKRVSSLIEYLIANREVTITKAKLFDVLWPDESSENPDGALRNLIYRAREELKKFFPGKEQECILLSNESYIWNPDIAMVADIDVFEMHYQAATRGADFEEQFVHIQKVIDIYTGEFLPESDDSNWVMFKGMYYRRGYIECVLMACEYLMINKQYDAMISICEKATHIEQVNEKVHEYYLRALDAKGEIQQAIEYYYYIVDLFYSKLGMDVSESLSEIYQTIIEKMPEYQVDIEHLEDRLKDKEETDGSYYCNYEIFKSIYQVNLRSVRRSRNAKFLVLLTLEEGNPSPASTERYKEQMELLREIMYKILRKNDVFTQFSATQYSIMLSAPNMSGCERAIARIEERFAQRNKMPDMRLDWDVKQIQ